MQEECPASSFDILWDLRGCAGKFEHSREQEPAKRVFERYKKLGIIEIGYDVCTPLDGDGAGEGPSFEVRG